MFDGRPDALLQVLSNQLRVIKGEAQALMGLCSLVVPVTGFSGAHLVRAGSLSAACMVIGSALVLVAAVCGTLRCCGVDAPPASRDVAPRARSSLRARQGFHGS
ncbi:MAG: hypothetical protein EXR79_10255 [Myxococcales bacterium]|nr:hypothetical protein [Myxococcales bacterium]